MTMPTMAMMRSTVLVGKMSPYLQPGGKAVRRGGTARRYGDMQRVRYNIVRFGAWGEGNSVSGGWVVLVCGWLRCEVERSGQACIHLTR